MPIVEQRALLALLGLAVTLGIASGCGSSTSTITKTRPVQVSRCGRYNAEPTQAVDGKYVYEAWIGCARGRIGFARSTDGGRTFGPAVPVGKPSNMPRTYEWDPAVAVA